MKIQLMELRTYIDSLPPETCLDKQFEKSRGSDDFCSQFVCVEDEPRFTQLNRLIIRRCAWCCASMNKDCLKIIAKQFDVSHTMCDSCLSAMIAELATKKA